VVLCDVCLFVMYGCLKDTAIELHALSFCAVEMSVSLFYFVPNRVLAASPPDISPLKNLLPRSVCTTLAQLHFGHCWLLNSYKARITSGISDVCPECGVAEHLFNCQSNPTQLTLRDLWDDPAAVADFLNLDN